MLVREAFLQLKFHQNALVRAPDPVGECYDQRRRGLKSMRNFPTEDIMSAQNSNFASKFPEIDF